MTDAELSIGDGEVFLGHPGPDYRNPKELGAFTDLVPESSTVENADAHHARAVEAGAPILTELHDTGLTGRPALRHGRPRRAPVVVRAAPARGRAGGVGRDQA